MTPVTGREAFRHLALFLSLAAITLAMTWPLAFHLSDHVIKAPYFWDAYTNTMLMGARVNALRGQLGIYENYFFAPITNTVAFNENLFGLSLLFAPFYLLTGNPLLAYNLVLLLSLVMSAYFTLLLVRRLSGSTWAGVIAGVGFAFSPYAMFEIGRIQLVATQWIPLFFLFLHRAAVSKRFRDLLGLAFAYAMQVGTCLYYAMFLLPLAAVMGLLLVLQQRPFPRRFWLQSAAAAGLCGALVAAMVSPYFKTRKHFSLVRSEDFAQDFDGKLSFFAHVYPDNRLLTFLHHLPPSVEGAHEEIAFPTFTITALCLCALVAAAVTGYRIRRREGWRTALLLPGAVLATSALAFGATLLAGSFLGGAAVVLAAVLLWSRFARGKSWFAPPLSHWLWALPLVLMLFLGLVPFEHHGHSIHGLYYFLHIYVPGFDGIRKVSRQAVMVMLCLMIIGGLGAAWLIEKLPRVWARSLTALLLLAALLTELRNAPLSLVQVPVRATVPPAYDFVAKSPGKAPIVIAPANFGQRRFVGQRGMALHNYLALYHRRRTLNGKSSWIPPVTQVVHRAIRALPSGSALRVLRILRPQFLVLHTNDMNPMESQAILEALDEKEDVVRRVFAKDGDVVYEFVPTTDSTLGLLPQPAFDEHAFVPISRDELRMGASRNWSESSLAIDGNPTTRWSTGRSQLVGDWIEFSFTRPREVAAIDFTDNSEVFEVPGAFKISVSDDGHRYRTVFRRRRLRFYHDQVYAPDRFRFRVVLKTPVLTRHLRMRLLQEIPGRYWRIHEATIWATPAPPPLVAPSADTGIGTPSPDDEN